MAKVTLSARGRLDAATAWERYAQVDEWSRWAPQLTRAQASAERIEAGVTGRVFGPLGVSADFVIDRVDEAAHRWAWTVRRWPLTVHLQHGVRSDGDGCRTWLVLDAPLPVALAYAPIAQLALRSLVARASVRP